MEVIRATRPKELHGRRESQYVNGFVFVGAVPFRYQPPLFYGGVPQHIQRQRRASDFTDRVRLLTFRCTVQLGTELVDSRSPLMRFLSSYTWKWLTHLFLIPWCRRSRRLGQAWEPRRGSLTPKGECPNGADPRNVQETRFLLTADITFQLCGQEMVTGKLANAKALVGVCFCGACWWLLLWRCPPRAPCRSPSPLRLLSFPLFFLGNHQKSRLRNMSLAGYDPRTVIFGCHLWLGSTTRSTLSPFQWTSNIAICDLAFVNFLNSDRAKESRRCFRTTESAKKDVCVISGTTATVILNHRSQGLPLLHFGATVFHED